VEQLAPNAPDLRATSEAHAAPQSWMLWAVAVVWAGVVTGSLVLTLASDQLDQRGLRAFLTAWIVVPYAASGMVAWWRRPASRLGPLMLATGLAMALSPLQWSSQPVVQSVGQLLDMLPVALFLHVFLAFPTGRLTRPSERLTVLACYVTVLGLQVVKVALGVNPANVFTLVHRPELANVVEAIQLSLVAALLLVGALILQLRRRRAGRWLRRPAALVADAFNLALVTLAALFLADLGVLPGAAVIRHVTYASLGLAPLAFLAALLDARLARGDVAGLVVELRDDPTTDLEGALRRALRDPDLQLRYWLPELDTWADQHGRPSVLGEVDERRAVQLISRGSEPMAALMVHRSLLDEPELLRAVAAAAGIALENGRLHAELKARLQELDGSRGRVLEAGRQERQRLERDLHDGAQQRLVALSLELALLRQGVAGDPELHARLATAGQEVSASLEELRAVAHGIYPAVLAGSGLAVALESVVARASVPTRLRVDLPGRLPPPMEVAAYYVVSEALTNLDKHAAARSAGVQVRQQGGRVLLDVDDDGVGGADPAAGSGLRGLVDRVEALGGELRITSPRAGGTRLHVELPCP
jgi:signal transduction histidine kinase